MSFLKKMMKKNNLTINYLDREKTNIVGSFRIKVILISNQIFQKF